MNAELRDLLFVGLLCSAAGFAAGQAAPPVWTPETPARLLTLTSEGKGALLATRNAFFKANGRILGDLSADRIRLMQETFAKNPETALKHANDATAKISELNAISAAYWDAALKALPSKDRRAYLKWFAKHRRTFEHDLGLSLLPPVPETIENSGRNEKRDDARYKKDF